MSFTFRNLFSEEGGDSNPHSPDGAQGEDSSRGFSEPPGDAARGSSPELEKSQKEAQEKTQSFMVSELLPFIPPAISAKSGIPMEDELVIPMPEDGSMDVKLSVVYQACPQMFAAEITPLNDSTITLPAKLGQEEKVEEAQVKLSGVAFGANPFSSGEESAKAEAKVDEENPFWSTEPLEKPEVEEPKGKSETDPATSVKKEDPLAGFSSPGFSSEPSKEELPTEEAATGFMGFGSMEPERTEKSPTADHGDDGGFAFPGGFETTQPFEEVSEAPGKASEDEPEPEEKAAEPFSGNAFDQAEGFSTLFSEQAEGDADIPFPDGSQASSKESVGGTWGTMFEAGSEIEDPASDSPVPGGFGDMLARESKNENVEGSPFDQMETSKSETLAKGPESLETPSEEKEDEPAPSDSFGFAAAQAAAEGKVFEQEVAGGFRAPEESVQPEDDEPEAQPEVPASEGFSSFASIGPIGGTESVVDSPEKEPEGIPTKEPEAIPTEPETIPTEEPKSVLTEEPKSIPADEMDTVPLEPNPFQTQAEVAVEESGPTPQSMPQESGSGVTVHVAGHSVSRAVSKSEAPVAQDPQPFAAPATIGGEDQEAFEEMPDLEMRAIFSSSDSFSLSRVARKIVELPGMQGCAIATPVHLVQASRSEESRLGDEAQEMVNTVKNLAKLTGLPDARSFTLQTDRGIVSLFMEGSCCLIVRHDSADFGPGVREKLIVISRNLYKLND